MKTYEDLNESEQFLFNKIDNIFRNSPSLKREMFCKILFMLGNKYKVKPE